MRRVITISREFGSGGRELGKRLAESLGMAYYDREIVSALAEKSGLAKEYIEHISEQGTSWYYPITYARTLTAKPPVSQLHIEVLSQQHILLRELAAKSDCVIVGRCADVVLREYKPLNIFVYASTASKLGRCREREEADQHLNDKELRRRIVQIDAGRARHREMVGGGKWGDKAAYHLCVNTTGLEIKALMPSVREFAACYFKVQNGEQP